MAKKFHIQIQNNSYSVHVNNISEGTAEVEVNGIKYRVMFEEIIDREALIAEVKKVVTAPSTPAPAQAPRIKQKAAPTAQTQGTLIAPMPGLIMDVYVTEGETIQEGQIVIKMEAMKMENEIPAPISGIVAEIRVKKGDVVKDGDVMLVIGGGE